MSGLERLLGALSDAEVEFILIGGVAARAHGSARITQDVDVSYGRREENLVRLIGALAPFTPYLRDAPAGLPFEWSARTLRAGLNFTLTTTAGDIDLLGEVTGGGRYSDLFDHTIDVTLFGLDQKGKPHAPGSAVFPELSIVLS